MTAAVIEEWREIPGSHGDYEVSSLGRVRSHKGRNPRMMSCFIVNTYPTVALRIDGAYRRESVHRLVLEAFVGPMPEGCEVVRHLDGDPTNNSLGNLAYGTQSENMQDAVRHGTSRNQFSDATHCKYGHPFSLENTYHRPTGGRTCRTCQRAAWHKWNAKRQEVTA